MTRIEEIWASMRHEGVSAQRRVTAEHACDLYADFEAPETVGLVAICEDHPILPRPMRAIAVGLGERADGRFSLRLILEQEQLLPVFAALCQDIVISTAEGVEADGLGDAVLKRLQRWRALLDRDAAGLPESMLRGLIGELTVLEARFLPTMNAADAVRAWQGPIGASQNFLLSDGHRIEVKAIDRDADAVTVNGLGQLDPGPDALTLAVVRLQVTGPSAERSLTPTRLVARLRKTLAGDLDAQVIFETALSNFGWHEHPTHDEFAFRIVSIDAYEVQEAFPRLTSHNVPTGVEDASYVVSLRDRPFKSWELTA